MNTEHNKEKLRSLGSISPESFKNLMYGSVGTPRRDQHDRKVIDNIAMLRRCVNLKNKIKKFIKPTQS